MSEKLLKHTSILIKERKIASLDGVENVIGFDESYIALETVAGKIVIEGQELKIQNLSKDTGEIEISGRVLGVFYSEEKSPKNLLARIFK
ncbi:MAG: hypothetical protein E7678_08265 [Ruminococcaceae bacterium]|nr:hypothetical protein [Oscillospiraceae bacterium]